MLTGGEPRGLPGMVIDRIELQRASEGRPLDDVIVHAHDASGTAAVPLASCAWTMISSSGLPSLARCSSIRSITMPGRPRGSPPASIASR